MAKQKKSFKETKKITHKLEIEGVIDINNNGKIIFKVANGEEKVLSDVAINFNGNSVKLTISEDEEEEIEQVENDDEYE